MLYAIKKAIADNIEGIAYLHKDRFRDHFLGHYPIFIIERFYESFLDTSLFFVALQENNVVGFVMGGTSTELQTFKKNFIKKNLFKCLLSTICIPSIYIDALYRAKQMMNRPVNKKGLPTPSAASIRLLSIAVSENMQGTG
jgi:hypothetical protein